MVVVILLVNMLYVFLVSPTLQIPMLPYQPPTTYSNGLDYTISNSASDTPLALTTPATDFSSVYSLSRTEPDTLPDRDRGYTKSLSLGSYSSDHGEDLTTHRTVSTDFAGINVPCK